VKNVARSLAGPLVIVALFAIAAVYEQEILIQLGIDTVARLRLILPYVIHTGIWLSLAYLANRLVGVLLWDPIHRRVPIPRLLRDVTAVLIYVIAITGIVGMVFKRPIGPFWAASGVGAIVLGLALRNVILDVFIGLAVNFDRPFEIGDYIKFGTGTGLTAGTSGRVVELNWRTTRLMTSEGNLAIIPNGRLGELIITNYSRPEPVGEFEVSIFVDFDVPAERALRVLNGAACSVAGTAGILEDPAPRARLRGVTASGVEYKIKYFLDPRLAGPGRARHELLRAVLDQLHRAGLQPAAPSQDIYHAPMPARKLDTGSHDDRARLLARVELFQGLTEEQRNQLSAQMKERIVKEATTLIRRGDAGDSMFVLCEGLLDVLLRVNGNENDTRIGRLQAGMFFGEMSLLTGEARSATVVAVTDALVFEIAKEHVATLIERRPELAQQLARTVAERKLLTSDAVRNASATAPAAEVGSLATQILGKMLAFFGVKSKPAITAKELAENSAQTPFI